MVVPFCAVTIVVNVFEPTARANAFEALPLVTAVPLTAIVEFASTTVGVTVIAVVAFETLAVYEVVPDANAGDRVPLDNDSADNCALLEPARVTTIVYDFVVPICAVTNVVIVLAPMESGTAPLALPLVVALPSTDTSEVESATVGVTVIEVVAFDTLAVYDVVPAAKAGDRVPLDNERLERFASLDAAERVIVVV